MIVRCKKQHLIARCFERGYFVANVLPCIVAHDGDDILVDTNHPAYPAKKKNLHDELLENIAKTPPIGVSRSPAPVTNKFSAGPGTELKKLLAKIGIKASPTCSCNKRAQIMDEKGIEWCKENIDMIVGWLREEATKRKLPFVDFAGKLLVQRAISLAEKAEKKRLAAQQQDQAQDG
jgi:hypothetical protein